MWRFPRPPPNIVNGWTTMLLQGVEYRETGVERVAGWIDSARKGLATETARRVAEAAVTLSPLTWRER